MVFGWGTEVLYHRHQHTCPQHRCRYQTTPLYIFVWASLTGNTTGIPPLTGLLPSSLAAVLSQSLSLPLLFQLVTVTPYSRTSTESPVGKVAMTLPLSLWTLGCGPVVEGEIAEGLFGRSGEGAVLVWLWSDVGVAWRVAMS